MLALRTPGPPWTLGEDSIGLTAGRGRDGAGETDLLKDGDELNEDRRLWEIAGGFIGKGREVGVPGAEGLGEAMASEDVSAVN